MRVIDYLGDPKRRWNIWLRGRSFIKVAAGESRKLIDTLSATLLFVQAHIDETGDIVVRVDDLIRRAVNSNSTEVNNGQDL